MKALFVNHKAERCGVANFGRSIGYALEWSNKDVDWYYTECSSREEFSGTFDFLKPDIVIFNWYPSTMSWYSYDLCDVPMIGIIHETGWILSNDPCLNLFDHIIHPDPFFVDPRGGNAVFRTPRLVPKRTFPYSMKFDVPTIGSFGFGFGDKDFSRLINMVQDEFDEALIRLHISFAQFGDDDGASARGQAAFCRSQLTKPGIELDISHDYKDVDELITWLAGNDLNVFMYGTNYGRGIASTTDYALAANKPIALTYSAQFRHLQTIPSIRIEDAGLKEIMELGVDHLQPFRNAWTEEAVVECYNNIVRKVLG